MRSAILSYLSDMIEWSHSARLLFPGVSVGLYREVTCLREHEGRISYETERQEQNEVHTPSYPLPPEYPPPLEQEQPAQSAAQPHAHRQPAPPAAPGSGQAWRANGAQSGHSPYRQRDYSGYVRKREPQPHRSPGGYARAHTDRPPSHYQYGAGGGWQQPQSPPGGRQWDFKEYDNAMSGGGRKTKARGLIVFAVAMLCVLCVSMLSAVGYNIILWATQPIPISEEAPGARDPHTPPAISPSGEVNLIIESRPPSGEHTPAVGELMTIPQVARAVRPSVVGVINYRTHQLLIPASEGSGIIITEDGYIVTNAHVVEHAESIVIVFDDKSEYEAALVGYDLRTDIAVLRVDRTGLPAAVLGDSNQLEVGETVIAIGNPGGLELAGTVTRGVVSAVNRVVTTPYNSVTYIQTDAAINPGNSGGPLSNEFGQVIGINTAKIVELGYEGIGFAIPISDAIPIIQELILNGRVTGRVLLGINGEIVNEVIARDRNVPAGVQITYISSPELSSRGVLRGDIITHMDGQRILNLSGIRTILATKEVGDTVTLTLYRPARRGSGNTFDVEVPLIEDVG